MVDAKAGASPGPNLGVIPDHWENYKSQGSLAHGTGTQIIFVDANVERTSGSPSIRIDAHTANDLNTARGCNGMWYSVKPGDHVVAKCWMRVLTGPSTSGYPQSGARIGIDFYAAQLLPATNFWHTYWHNGNYSEMYVQDSNGGAWQQRSIDFIVPATVGDSNGNPVKPTSFVLWMQGAPWTAGVAATPVWFADAELYINPTTADVNLGPIPKDINPTTADVNLGPIPNAWEAYLTQGRITHGVGPQIVFLDTGVTHNGKASIRCDGPATSTNQWREVDSYNYSGGRYTSFLVKPGDRVVFKIWIKTNPSTIANPTQGAIFGIDLYGSARIWEVAWGYPATTDFNKMNYSAYRFLPYNTPAWTQGMIDFIVPSKTFTSDSEGVSISAQTVRRMIPWVCADPRYPSAEAGKVWFSDAELYINPITSTVPQFQLISPTDGSTYQQLNDVRVRITDPTGISSDPAHHPTFFDHYTGTLKWYWVSLISGTVYDGIWQLNIADPVNVAQGWVTRTTAGTYQFMFGARNNAGNDGFITGSYTIGAGLVR